MRSGHRRVDVLLLANANAAAAELMAGLRSRDIAADAAVDLDSARRAFLARGGHGLLVLAPTVRPSLARAVVDSLRAVDPELEVLVFCNDLLREQRDARLSRASGLHLGSRAGIGAVLKALHRAQ